jgi:hypothetical protein
MLCAAEKAWIDQQLSFHLHPQYECPFLSSLTRFSEGQMSSFKAEKRVAWLFSFHSTPISYGDEQKRVWALILLPDTTARAQNMCYKSRS